MRKFRLALALLIASSTVCLGQQYSPNNYRALDFAAVTVGGTPVAAVTGPAYGCQFTSSVDLIVDTTGKPGALSPAGTSASGTSQLLPAGQPWQCGALATGAIVSVNCSGGGTCNWQGNRW